MDTFFLGFKEYGLIGLIFAVVFFILWKMIVWIMAFIKDITAQQAKEREQWLCTLGKHSDFLNKISDNIIRHDERSDERGKYVKEEHNQMIEILSRINGHNK